MGGSSLVCYSDPDNDSPISVAENPWTGPQGDLWGFSPFSVYPRLMADNVGKYPIDYESDIGKVRVLLSDTSPTNIVGDTGEYLFESDDGIQAMLDLKGTPARTAVYFWRLIAMTPALQYKKWSSADLSVDGPAITRAIRDIINDIEKGIAIDDEAAVSEYFNVVNTGPAMSQPALFPQRVPQYRGVDIDPTLPMVL